VGLSTGSGRWIDLPQRTYVFQQVHNTIADVPPANIVAMW